MSYEACPLWAPAKFGTRRVQMELAGTLGSIWLKFPPPDWLDDLCRDSSLELLLTSAPYTYAFLCLYK